MNTIRGNILDKIKINGRLNHFCLNKEWFIKNKIPEIYNNIIRETGFLDEFSPTFRERIFYIENNLYHINKCKYCNKKTGFNKSKVNFYKTCGGVECVNKNKSENMKKIMSDVDYKKKRCAHLKLEGIKWGKKCKGKSLIEIHGKEIGEKIKHKAVTNITKLNKDKNIISKKIKSRRNNNPQWHTNETINKIKNKNKIVHNSQQFKEKYKDVYEKSRKKISDTMRKKILNGEFTPCITNSWTHWDAYVKRDDGKIGKKFRSNWDAAFWILNKECEYEKIRISYKSEGKEKIYIVDFVDEKNRILYEIKPSSLKNKKENVNKRKSAIRWCKSNNFEYVEVNDDWFIKNINKIDFDFHDNLKKSFVKFING